jgi:hypothetical protein
MKKSNHGQTVGNLSTRAGVHPKQEKLRHTAEEALLTRYDAARMECTKSANRKNRTTVDGLRKRIIRRQYRRIYRDRKVRDAQKALDARKAT